MGRDVSRMRWLKIIGGCAAAACVFATVGTALGADAVPSAKYTAQLPGGTLEFTISPDGTIVDSYRAGLYGDNCYFTGGGDPSGWRGAPINSGSFNYTVGTKIVFKGSFTGPQSAVGVLRFSHDAVYDSHGKLIAQACDTGNVNWTASTDATPRSQGGGSGSGGSGGGGNGGSGNGGGSGGGHAHIASFATRVVLHRSARKLGGWLTTSRACRMRRTVTLWLGAKRFARTTTTATGTFSFPRSKRVRGQVVRASVTARSVSSGTCAAGSSLFLRA